ncbi:hypothetical protein [Chelativorans sp. AA-79]|uniref:helix-turn-helix transcriptional regulator n=1 Tax=Chelativorans sp. AA-79 TaxID=3028735 RepID=UPI0023F98132|nr:hypothetical protein [Chelativorans sp. AA-79]WEX07523.1 hypothetical protein PVE73_15520 [Chelativorans sp. AA-79]
MHGESYENALDICYEAVAFPELWSSALDRLAHALGATGAMFYPKDVNENATTVPSSSVYGGLLEDYVAGGWYLNHYRAIRGWNLFLSNRKSVIIEHDLASDEERKGLPHYNELYLKWGFPGFAAIGFKVDGDPWCLPLIRSRHEGFFTPEEAARLAKITPHLRRMVKLGNLIASARSATGLSTFDTIGQAALLLDGRGRVIALNACAEELLARNAGCLHIKRGRLLSADGSNDLPLQSLVAAAVDWSRSTADTEKVLPISIERPARLPIMVEAISSPAVVRTVSPNAHAIILLKDPELHAIGDPARISSLLGLTPAESMLCLELATGASVAKAASTLGIAESTARQRLKAVFQKTGVHRQSELLLLVRGLNQSR